MNENIIKREQYLRKSISEEWNNIPKEKIETRLVNVQYTGEDDIRPRTIYRVTEDYTTTAITRPQASCGSVSLKKGDVIFQLWGGDAFSMPFFGILKS